MRTPSIVMCFALSALTLATAAPGQADDASIQSAPQLGVTTDHALIARHQALARLGERTVEIDPAVIARHRALGRLPLSASMTSLGTPAGSSTSSFPWKEAGFGFAATAALALIGFGVVRSGREWLRGSGV